MKIYKVYFSNICFIVAAKDIIELISILKNNDNNFINEDNKIYYQWRSDYKEECQIESVPCKSGIIHIESH